MKKAIKSILAVWILVSAGFTGLYILIPEEEMRVSAITITVDDDGTADYSGIQDAIDAASEGDTVFVHSGTYDETISIDKTITLSGEDRETTAITGGGANRIIDIEADWVNVSGFTITDGGYGIFLFGGGNNNITDNDISSNSEAGIYISGSDCNNIADNYIFNNRDGIFIFNCENNNITGNDVQYNLIGIGTGDQTINNFIHHNIIINNNYNAFHPDVNQWDDGQEGNYWGDYNGVDDGTGGRIAGDGVGDTLLPHSGIDWYPLMLSTVDFYDTLGVVDVGQEIDIGSYYETKDYGTIIKKSWDFDASNGIQEDAVGEAPKHSYSASGIYTATLTVTLEEDITLSDNLTVCVVDEHLISLKDGTGDVMNEDGQKVGGHPNIDMTNINLWEVGDFLLFEMRVNGTIQDNRDHHDTVYLYALDFFMDETDNIKDTDDSEFRVACTLGSTYIQNVDTKEILFLEAYGNGTSTLWILIPTSFIGDTTDFEINAQAVVYFGWDYTDQVSYVEAYGDWSVDADEGEDFLISLCLILFLVLVVVLVVGIIIAVLMIKRMKSSQKMANAQLDMQAQQPSWEPQQQPQSPQPQPMLQLSQPPPPPPPPPEEPLTEFQLLQPPDQLEMEKQEALDILKKRLARGEIDLKTYRELKKELE